MSQGRQPCWKLNDRFDVKDMALKVQNTGRTGWYFRVLEPGRVKAGDSIKLINRPYSDWNISRIASGLYNRAVNLEELAQLRHLPLPKSWASLIERKYTNLQNKQSVEIDSSARLKGPQGP